MQQSGHCSPEKLFYHLNQFVGKQMVTVIPINPEADNKQGNNWMNQKE
jgi:hypothetical protein